MLPSPEEPARSALKSSDTVAGQNMLPTAYSSGHFSNMFPLLDDSTFGSAVQATASLQYYNSPYNPLTPPAMLSPDSFVNLGFMVAPELPLRREHAASPAIQQRLLKIGQNTYHREIQNTSTDPSDLASDTLFSAAKVVSPRGFSSTISEDFKLADGHVLGLHRDSQKVSIQANCKRSQSTHDMAISSEYLVHYGKDSPNVSQTCPRPNNQPGRTNTTAVSMSPQSRRSLDVFGSPVYKTCVSSTSVSPEGSFSWSPQQTYSTPASSDLYNTSKNNSPNSVVGEQTRMLSAENNSQNAIPNSSSKPRKRKLSPGEGLQKECESSTGIPVDLKSASHSEGQRRKHEREASARYRQKKKVQKSAKLPEEVNKSVAISTTSSNAKECGTDGSMNLAPPTSTEMTLSSSQQSFSSILSGSTQVSASSATNCDAWPNLPELHPYERRRKINYGPLAPYGSAETIESYPPSFQASLHRVMDFQRTEFLKANSYRVLFVYGSLMISDLWHDVFVKTTEWVFHNEIVKKCMCPAKVPGYSRFSVLGSDEPVMMKAEKNASVSTHGMLIFGLNAEDFRVLDRYLADGFVQEDVSAYVNLKSSTTNFEVSAYVWPRDETRVKGGKTVRIHQGVEWTVERFWAESRLCRIYRETVMEHSLQVKARGEQTTTQDSMAEAHVIRNA